MTLVGHNVINVMHPTGPLRLWDCNVTWADLEPVQGQFNWTKLDQLVDQAGNRSVMLVLGHPPLWAARDPDGGQAPWLPAGTNRPPKNYGLWENYVKAVARRYKGRIDQYQIWNEPADPKFYSGEYLVLATMTQSARKIIDRIDSRAMIVSAPLQPRIPSGWPRKANAIMRAYHLIKYPFDIWAAHIYPVSNGITYWAHDARVVYSETKRRANKPLWITETNMNLLGKGNPWPIAKQTETIDKMLSQCYTIGIPRIYLYGYGHTQPELFAIGE